MKTTFLKTLMNWILLIYFYELIVKTQKKGKLQQKFTSFPKQQVPNSPIRYYKLSFHKILQL